MIKVAICEDSKLDLQMLQKIVEFLMKDRGLDFQIETFLSGEELLAGYKNHPSDLIFLDIMMDEIDGIKTGKEIRSLDSKVEIVYCTSSSDFALAAYEVHAMGYLLKPYEPSRIAGLFCV